MIYYEKVELKNGKEMIIRNADYNDGKAVHDLFIETHQQTDYLLMSKPTQANHNIYLLPLHLYM